MSQALIGVLGVLGGVILTGGVQLGVAVIDRRRNARVAARLLYMHLWWARQSMEAAFDEGVWNPNIDWEVFNAAWAAQRTALAFALKTEAFLTVAGAFTSIEQLAMTRANDLSNPQQPSFSLIKSEVAAAYRKYVEGALLIVNWASFTRGERRKGLHLPNQRKAESRPPGATGKDLGLLLITDGSSASEAPPIP